VKGEESQICKVMLMLVEMVFPITVNAINGGGGIEWSTKGIKK
jgi:hypothetical protein